MSEIDARSAIDAFGKAGEKLTEDLQREAEIKKLTAEVEHQKAIAEAMLDSLHKLGEDYRKALEEEQQHIREAKIEAAKEVARMLVDICYNGTISVAEILETVVVYMNEGV